MASDDLKALLASFDDDEAEEEFQDEIFNEQHDQSLFFLTFLYIKILFFQI